MSAYIHAWVFSKAAMISVQEIFGLAETNHGNAFVRPLVIAQSGLSRIPDWKAIRPTEPSPTFLDVRVNYSPGPI